MELAQYSFDELEAITKLLTFSRKMVVEACTFATALWEATAGILADHPNWFYSELTWSL